MVSGLQNPASSQRSNTASCIYAGIMTSGVTQPKLHKFYSLTLSVGEVSFTSNTLISSYMKYVAVAWLSLKLAMDTEGGFFVWSGIFHICVGG